MGTYHVMALFGVGFIGLVLLAIVAGCVKFIRWCCK